MAIYQLHHDKITEVPRTTFSAMQLKERTDIQRVLKDFIDIISPNTMVLAEEFGEWTDSRRRIDLLGLNKQGQLVVIELKRTEDGGHMELQALRYAAMVSTMTFDQATAAHQKFLASEGLDPEGAEQAIREFLNVEDENITFSDGVKIVLASADFSKEITSSVLWLNEQGLDITCVRLRPHQFSDELLLDVQQIIPLPEAAEFQVAIREKSRERDAAEKTGRDFTKYSLCTTVGEFSPLNKRNFVFQIVREAVRLGISPDAVASAVTWRRYQMFISCPGHHSAASILEANPGKSGHRFFCREDEVFFVQDVSYLMTNQWGARTEEAVDEILKLLPPDHGVSYHALP
ncbi:hypothetical protein ECAE60S_04421 [Eoetvoesiella caeni]